MISDEIGRKLHDRATRGEALAAEDEARLLQWYGQQDRTEADALLSSPAARVIDIDNLRAEVSTAVNELAEVTRRIQQLQAENERLRHEVADLQQQLGEKAVAHTQ